MDPSIEIIFREDPPFVATERYQLPLFFLLGGVDDTYLSNLMGVSVSELHDLIKTSSSDPLDSEIGLIGVFGSRGLLSPKTSGTRTYVRTFPLVVFLREQWPILSDLYDPTSRTLTQPTEIEQTWIIRALRRNNLNREAEIVRANMLRRIYPEKIPSTVRIGHPTRENIALVQSRLTFNQKQYPAVVIVDDLPIKLNQTIGELFTEIALTGYTTASQAIIQTSLDLLHAH